MHCKRPQRTHHTNNNATLQRIRLSYSEYDVAQCTKTWSMCIFMKRAQEKLLAIFKNSTIRCAMKTTKWHLDVYWFVFFRRFLPPTLSLGCSGLCLFPSALKGNIFFLRFTIRTAIPANVRLCVYILSARRLMESFQVLFWLCNCKAARQNVSLLLVIYMLKFCVDTKHRKSTKWHEYYKYAFNYPPSKTRLERMLYLNCVCVCWKEVARKIRGSHKNSSMWRTFFCFSVMLTVSPDTKVVRFGTFCSVWVCLSALKHYKLLEFARQIWSCSLKWPSFI